MACNSEVVMGVQDLYVTCIFIEYRNSQDAEL